MTFHGGTYPLWLVALLGAGALAYVVSVGMYVIRRDVPVKVYAPLAAAAFGSCAFVAIFACTRNVEWIQASLVCSGLSFWAIGRIVAYRWNHGGEDRFRKRTEEMRAIAQRREAR